MDENLLMLLLIVVAIVVNRAPVLVAIALIEYGLDPINAVEHIRKFRRGAINLRQLKYLEKYQPRRGNKGKCFIM